MDMMTDVDSGPSSPLSSPPSSTLSSPLSSPASSPSPPPEFALDRPQSHLSVPYPSPPSSQQTSQSGSPGPDGMDSGATTDKEGPPPPKRRRISKERTTEYLDLADAEVDTSKKGELDRLMHVLHKRQKIVVICGAGISVSAGIPDFRSSTGLFRSLKGEHKLKGSGKDLFDASVYKSDISTSTFHDMVSSMSRLTKDAKPTAFHHMLATIAKEGRLLRLYSQNVDGIDTSLEPLKTSVPLRKSHDGKWPRTVQLHGGLDKMVCSKCNEITNFDADLFTGSVPPLCSNCLTINDIRTRHEGKRSHGIGRLRPRMVLYNEHNPDAEAIGAVTCEDLRRRPDAVIVAGTTLKVPGVKAIVKQMCASVRDRRSGVAIWINKDPTPMTKEFEDCFDIVVQGTCDEVATRAGMRKWFEPEDTMSEISEENAIRAATITAEVQVPRASNSADCLLVEPLRSKWHINNSCIPPPVDVVRQTERLSPTDWSPMPNRTSSIQPSIEQTSDEKANIDGAAASQVTPFTDRLKAVAQTKSHSNTGRIKAGPNKNQKTVKDVKRVKTTTKAFKTAPAAGPSGLLGTFKTTKSTKVQDQAGTKQVKPLPGASPIKLRNMYNASSLGATSLLSPTVSPSKSRAFFPGL